MNAMAAATDVLAGLGNGDRSRALTALSEAVWSVTIVDATLLRHYPAAYDAATAALSRSQRRVTEETLAGLRFVRNRIGQKVDLAELVGPRARDSDEAGSADSAVTDWVWRPVPAPEVASGSSRAQAWAKTRYRAYQAQLAGRPVADSLERAVAFLQQTAEHTHTPTHAHPIL